MGALKCQNRKTLLVESQRDNVVGSKCFFFFFCNFRRKSPTDCLNVTNESILRVEGGDNEPLVQVSFARLCGSLIYPDGEKKELLPPLRVKLFKK